MSALPRGWCAGLFTTFLLMGWASAQEPARLTQARLNYEKELERVQAPIRERYLRTLQEIHKDFVAKGNTMGAEVVQLEIDGLLSQVNLKGLAGNYEVIYKSGAIRHYTITEDGQIDWADFATPKRATLTPMGNVFLVSFNDNKVERLTRSLNTFTLEHFDPASKLTRNEPGVPAIVRKVK